MRIIFYYIASVFSSSADQQLIKPAFPLGFNDYHVVLHGIYVPEKSSTIKTSNMPSEITFYALNDKEKAKYLQVLEDYFIDTIIFYLRLKYWGVAPPDLQNQVRKCVKYLYNNICDWNELLIFISNAIFTTGGFRNLKANQIEPDEKYYSRGILQITTHENYKKLSEITCNVGFFYNPDILAELDDDATSASLAFWNYLVDTKRESDPSWVLNWDSALLLLNTREVQPEYEDEYRINKENRFKVYLDILNLFWDENIIIHYFKRKSYLKK